MNSRFLFLAIVAISLTGFLKPDRAAAQFGTTTPNGFQRNNTIVYDVYVYYLTKSPQQHGYSWQGPYLHGSYLASDQASQAIRQLNGNLPGPPMLYPLDLNGQPLRKYAIARWRYAWQMPTTRFGAKSDNGNKNP